MGVLRSEGPEFPGEGYHGYEDQDTGDQISQSLSRYRNSKMAEHVHLCAVQKAMAEVIAEQQLKPSPTAYFAAVMAALERERSPNPGGEGRRVSANQKPLHTAMLSLLAMALPKVPQNVLRSKMDGALGLVLGMMGSARGSEAGEEDDEEGGSAGLAKAGLQCLQHLLQAADKSSWPSLAQGFGVLLQHTVDPRPKVRKRAQACLVEVFADIRGSPSHGMASEAVVTLCERLLAAALNPQQAGGSASGKKSKKEAKADAGREGRGSNGGGPKALQTPGAKAAVAALHLLGALKLILPLLSSSAINRVMVRLAELNELHQPMLTRHVLDTFQALFRSTAPISAVALGEVLARLMAEEGRAAKRDAAEIRGMAQVVEQGLGKLYELDPRACARRLPLAFHTLVASLASEQEEVVYVAADSLRTLIGACIDEALIQEGLTNHGLAPELRGKAGPSAIERICATLESSLQYQYSTAWDMCLLLVAALFDRLGPASYPLLCNTVRTLGQLQELPDSEMRCRKQLHAAIGSAVAAMGPDQFLSLLPLEMDGPDLSTSRVWLLPILRQHMVGGRLMFFVEKLLPLAARLRERSRKAAADDRPVASKNAEACVLAVWGLLPAVCNHPTDTAASFRQLAKVLGDALAKEADLRPTICTSLQILIKQNRAARGDSPVTEKRRKGQVADDEDEVLEPVGPAEERAREQYTPEVARANLSAIASFSRNFLPLLFNAFVGERPEKRADLQSTIAAFAGITDRAGVKSFFVAVMQKLLQATQEESAAAQSKEGGGAHAMQTDKPSEGESATSKRCTFMDLALSLAPGLDNESLHMLYVTAKPALQDGDVGVQKRAYKLVARLCESNEGFVEAHAEDLLEHLLAGLPSCLSSAKRHRLQCLHHLIIHMLQKGDSRREEAVAALLSEIILATKEANTKTRNAAYDLLVVIPRSMEAATPGSGGSNDAIVRFFSMVVGGLGGASPHMLSASVVALARLLYEFSSDLIHTVPELLPSALLLLRSKSREIIKAVLGLVKVVIARLPGGELETHVPSLLEGLLLWCNDSKNHFKMKVRVILERLVRRCGFDVVARAMPEEHMKLLTHIRKTKEREQRKKRDGTSDAGDEDAKSAAAKSRASTGRKSAWAHTDIFSDDDLSGGSDEDFASTQATTVGAGSQRKSKNVSGASARTMRGNRKLRTRLPEDVINNEDEPLDLLDTERTRRVLSAPAANRRKRDEEEEMDYEQTEDGKFIITEDDDNRRKKRRKDEMEEDEDGDGRSEGGRSSRLGGGKREKGVERKGKKGMAVTKGGKRTKAWAYTGEEYAAGKGKTGGDTKKAGKLEPHAYWPLDPKMLNRREVKRAAARKGMASVLKAGKKKGTGVALGNALKAKGGVRKGAKKHKVQGHGKGKGKAGKQR